MRASAQTSFVLAWVLVPSLAIAAEPLPSLDLRGFDAPMDPNAGIYLEPASTPQTWDYNVGFRLNYVNSPITLRDASDERAFTVIEHQLTGDFITSVGIAERLALGLDLPLVMAQGGDDVSASPNAAALLGDAQLPSTAIGDLGLNAKLTLIQPTGGEFGGFALGLTERLSVPTGDEGSYLGEGHVASTTRLLAEYRLVAASVHLAAGVKFRGEEERFACENIALPSTGEDPCTTRFGHELPFGFGLSLRPQALGLDQDGRWTWYLETRGHLPVSPVGPFDDSRLAAWNAGVGARYAIRDVSLFAGVETAILDGVGSTPIRGILAIDWAPRVHDSDRDGVEDIVDQCRELPEDRDGFEDGDGCPEGDNDEDGVPDDSDRCPDTLEDEDGYQDDDGCPDPDNDGDGVLDDADACADEAGLEREGDNNGCPIEDSDKDGIEGEADKCPNEPEDMDGHEDTDGCPDPDNDGDSVLDAADACPNVVGVASEDPKTSGCPNPDADMDTFPTKPATAAEGGTAAGGFYDQCPNEAEVFNGVDDSDGCPDGDGKAAPLVEIRDSTTGPSVRMSQAIKFTDEHTIQPASQTLLRALAVELMKQPTWMVLVGVRSSPTKGADDGAEMRAKAVVESMSRFARKPVAKAVPFKDVIGEPGAGAHGIGFKIVTDGSAKPTPVVPSKPAPAEPSPAAPDSPEAPPKPAPAQPAKPPPPPAAPPAPVKPAPTVPPPAPPPPVTPPPAKPPPVKPTPAPTSPLPGRPPAKPLPAP